MSETRKKVRAFVKEQEKLGLKRSEIARGLFAWKFSSGQVGEIMEVHAKTAHAMKINFTKEGKLKRAELGHPDRLAVKAFLKDAEGHSGLRHDVKGYTEFKKEALATLTALVGEPFGVRKERRAKIARLKALRTKAVATAPAEGAPEVVEQTVTA